MACMIEWKIHCASTPEKIFKLLNSNDGRRNFWAESAQEIDGHIHFLFPNGQLYKSRIIEKIPHKKFSLIYFDSLATFNLSESENGTTDLSFLHEKVPVDECEDVKAGWISVLLALKALADFGVDIRNHNKGKTWDHGYVDN